MLDLKDGYNMNKMWPSPGEHRMVANGSKCMVPNTTFKTRVAGEWLDVTTDDLFKNKKVVIFSLPGAFTPTCSSTHLPGYELKADSIKETGIDEVYCISVNDAFVMNAWAKDLKAEKIKMIPDGNGKFTEGMGMLINKEHLGFGKRSWRYSAVVDNGEVIKMFIESGKNDIGEDQDPFETSDVDTMLKYLRT
jgi:peroxiredoxin